jgi:phospholipase/carboxylesterase
MIGDLRAGLNLHPERVFLAGFGTSGARALQLLLHRPEHFAGAAVLSASIPAGLELPADRTLEGRRILLARGSRDRTVCEVRLAECARRLEQFGAQVETATFDASHHLSRAMLLHVDRWMMDAVCCADRG